MDLLSLTKWQAKNRSYHKNQEFAKASEPSLTFSVIIWGPDLCVLKGDLGLNSGRNWFFLTALTQKSDYNSEVGMLGKKIFYVNYCHLILGLKQEDKFRE